eukprot:1867403-Amphidinium_carterae.1
MELSMSVSLGERQTTNALPKRKFLNKGPNFPRPLFRPFNPWFRGWLHGAMGFRSSDKYMC